LKNAHGGQYIVTTVQGSVTRVDREPAVMAVLAIAGTFARPVRPADQLTRQGNAAASVARARAGGRACLVCGERARCATTATRRLDPGAGAVWIDLCRRHYWQLFHELVVHAAQRG
jgi:hypothetical protein